MMLLPMRNSSARTLRQQAEVKQIRRGLCILALHHLHRDTCLHEFVRRHPRGL